MSWLDELKFDADGLIPVVAQESGTGEVLMVAFANRAALETTGSTGRAHYWSRSRGELWEKGATSGHTQQVEEIRVDCDGDAVIYQVRQTGPACHTLAHSCFFRRVEEGELRDAPEGGHILSRLEAIVRRRDEERPEESYTTYLFEKGLDKVLKKVGEETAEVIIAAKNESPAELRSETADLFFHVMVLLRARGLPVAEIWAELEQRFGRPSRIPAPRASNHPHS
jgi:phosphoribosyl-ATP pyrophosphohydrolase/phosphoribosyl-AMP cyclohydrolase